LPNAGTRPGSGVLIIIVIIRNSLRYCAGGVWNDGGANFFSAYYMCAL